MEIGTNLIKLVSGYAVPLTFFFILLTGMLKGVRVYDDFAEGAKEGIATVVRIIPALVGLMAAISVFRASGALDLLVFVVSPITRLLGIPAEALPLAFLRPISGSATLAMVSDLLKKHGPDSFIGRVASVMMGSTETIFYTIAVYFGSVGIKKTRYTLAAALVAEAVGVLMSVWLCSLVFR